MGFLAGAAAAETAETDKESLREEQVLGSPVSLGWAQGRHPGVTAWPERRKQGEGERGSGHVADSPAVG